MAEFVNVFEGEDNDYIPKQHAIGKEIVSESGVIQWLPEVDDGVKPVRGAVFETINDAYNFYKHYACQGGFEVRKSTQTPVRRQRVNDGHHTIKIKYFVCSKEGFNTKKEEANLIESDADAVIPKENHVNGSSSGCNTSFEEIVIDNNCEGDNTSESNKKVGKQGKQKRRRPSQRIGCQASFKLQLVQGNKYELYSFVEEHNHCLVHPDYTQHLKSYRRLDNSMKTMLHNLLLAGIGPTVGHRILTKIHGGHDKVGATPTDCRNYKRDVNAYIGKADAQMLVGMLNKKKEFLPNFSFEYFTEDDGTLGGFFWADDCAKRNYFAFGDVVSFDATYRSNKYNMVFVPFTGVDNHKRCITFGAGMLKHENVVSYKWLITAFMNAFPREPKIVMTDQDPALKIAVKETFVTARHRLCMWHIMEKLSTKVGASICNSGLKAQLSKIVWTDKLDPIYFENRWADVINTYNLHDNNWLHDMYNLRSNWIPAYFRECNMSGLMRTSSRSESENHMFGQLMSSSSTLVEFLGLFETAMQSQRFSQSKNDHETMYTKPDLNPECTFEKDAVRIYNRAIFYDVQKEIVASSKHCMSQCFSNLGGCIKYTIIDTSVTSICIDESIDREANPKYFDELIPAKSLVCYTEVGQELLCTCKRYERFGFLCRHIFYVLKACKIKRFPQRYICRRWTRDAVPEKHVHTGIQPTQVGSPEGDTGALIREIYKNFDYCVNKLMLDPEKLALFRDSQQDLVQKLDQQIGNQLSASPKEFIGAMLGVAQPDEVNVHPPKGIVNKGGGKRTRITSSREESISKSNKPLRMCAYCKIKTDHDIRNCKVRKKDEADAKVAAAEAGNTVNDTSTINMTSPILE